MDKKNKIELLIENKLRPYRFYQLKRPTYDKTSKILYLYDGEQYQSAMVKRPFSDFEKEYIDRENKNVAMYGTIVDVQNRTWVWWYDMTTKTDYISLYEG